MEGHSVTSPHDRDKTNAEMLRRSLSQNPDGESTVTGEDCPEPEILAAYFECSLNAEETARYELHFSQCAMCREQIAVIARADKLLAVADEELRRPAPSAWIWNWRWIAPAAAVLIVGLVWMARRQEEQRLVANSQRTELRTSDGSPQAYAPEPSTPLPNVPAQSAAVPRAGPNVAVDKTQVATSQQSAAASQGANSALDENLTSNNDEKLKQLAKSAPESARDSEGQALAAQSAPDSPAPSPAPLGHAAGGTVQAEPDTTSPRLQAKQLATPARETDDTVEKKRSAGLLIPTPDSQLLWRIRGAGFVERSTDGGATWHGELPNPNAHLVAGSAPSAQICWLVGNSGMILLTEDGAAWIKLPPPVVADFIDVAAKDALSATITAADGRKFTTTDGAKHWTPLP
jgi:hypothetical protein